MRGITLAEHNPELIEEWDFKKNIDIDPYEVAYKSNKKVWWVCKKDEEHIWKTSIQTRIGGSGCPYCKGNKVLPKDSFGALYKNLIKEWNWEKNVLDPYELTPKSGKRAWWICTKNNKHQWDATIEHRVNGRGCPFCTGKKVLSEESFASLHKELLDEWDWSKNKNIDPYKLTPKSNKQVYWLCRKDNRHQWTTKLQSRTKENGTGCPYCSGDKVLPEDSFGALYKIFLEEWDWEKNKGINPYEITPKSGKKVWWICQNDNKHQWTARIADRTYYGCGCPECNRSKGEKRIEEYLYKNNILYETQKEFEGLKGINNGNLSYDFHLPQHNLLIEYQGEQHEKFTKGMHKTIKDFKKQQEHDRRKREFAQQNNIQLLEIWYWDFDNIDNILQNILAR